MPNVLLLKTKCFVSKSGLVPHEINFNWTETLINDNFDLVTQGPLVQNYKIYVIPNGVIEPNNYIISFSYSIQNYVSDQRVIGPTKLMKWNN
jgi:hypothetical protein